MGTRISSANQLLLGRSNIQFNGAGGRQPYIDFMSDRFGPLTNAAGIRANGVPGVFSVTNNLQVVKP